MTAGEGAGHDERVERARKTEHDERVKRAEEEETARAKKDLKERSFTIELDRPIPDGQEIIVVKYLGTEGGRHRYEVVFFDPKICWR